MAFLCPTRVKRDKKLKESSKPLSPAGRITGSTSLDTLVEVEAAKQSGTEVRMVVIQDFEPCVSDETRVKRGQQVKVLYQENDWLFVITPEGKEGFVPYSYCLPLERSVDDFAEILQRNKERQTKVSKHEPPPISSTTRAEARGKRTVQSVPDIAQSCEFGGHQSSITKGSTRSSVRHNPPKKDAHSESCTPHIQEWDALPWEDERFSRRSMRDLTVTEIKKAQIKERSRSWDRGERTRSTRDESNEITSRQSSNHNSSSCVVDKTNNQFSHHVYANNDVVSTWGAKSRTSKQNKPDILPASTESVNTSSSRVSLASGSSWRNLSTRSAPNCSTQNSKSKVQQQFQSHAPLHPTGTRSQFQRSTSYQPSSHHHHQCGSQSGYTTAHVTCDYFKPSPDVKVSVFSKANRGRHVVLYNYDAQDEGDLTVEQGDIIHVLNTEDTAWFWVIDEHNREGFIPAKFVHPDERYQPNITGPPEVRSQDTTMSSNHQRSVSFPVDLEYSQGKPPTATHTKDLSASTRLVCVYNHVAQSEKDLSIVRGDWLFTNFDDQKHDSWLWVYSPTKRQSGYVPRSYVKAPNFGFHGSPVSNITGDVTNIRAVNKSLDSITTS